jgi:hypothetical protein
MLVVACSNRQFLKMPVPKLFLKRRYPVVNVSLHALMIMASDTKAQSQSALPRGKSCHDTETKTSDERWRQRLVTKDGPPAGLPVAGHSAGA